MNKDTLFNKILTLRRLFVVGNILILVLFLIALGQDQSRGWKKYQKEFKSREITRLHDELKAATDDAQKDRISEELKAIRRMPVEIRQIWNPETGAVDRCITCHTGMDPLANSTLTTPYTEHPYKATAGSAGFDVHKAHDLEKFGCVVCHGGQGIATEVEAAHGHVEHWETPMLTGTLLQASCAKCHDNLTELKLAGEVYPSEVIRAKKLFRDSGCIGCHQVGGEGGPISVDLKEETSAKPLTRIDFSNTGLKHEDWTLANWIKMHLVMDPAVLVPGDPKGHFNTEPIAPSAMPPYMMPEKDAQALTAYVLGLNRSGIPVTWQVRRPPTPEPVGDGAVQKGRLVYEKFGCAACHGPDARGGIRNHNYQYDVTPNLRRAVATYSRQELKDKISEGVAFSAKHDAHGANPPLYMPAWKAKIKGDDLENLVTYLQSIQE